MTGKRSSALGIPGKIRTSGLSIYDPLDAASDLFFAMADLEEMLRSGLKGLNLDYPLRTRSKVLKSAVCTALGYPVPPSFRKTNPRFPGQDFDTYIQKSNNLQIWNEELTPSRRYVLIRVNGNSIVTNVRVVAGEALARLDPTGTLTQKFQAKSHKAVVGSVLGSKKDTENLRRRYQLTDGVGVPTVLPSGPTDVPTGGLLLPLQVLFERLVRLVGTRVTNPGVDQERNRGAALHRAVCLSLGYESYQDRGQFPDILNQLLEVKLQTATTIDLGLITPDSTASIVGVPGVQHRDVRYAIFYGTSVDNGVRIDHLVLTTGKEFFGLFRRFEGLVLNKKLQIPLPADFFGQPE